MGIVDDLSDLFLDTIIATPIVSDIAGGFTPSGAVLSLPCRIEGEARLVRDSTGREVTSSVQVIVAGYNDLTTHEHRYTLPARYNPRTNLTAIYVDKVSSDTEEECYEELFFQ
jgi:hypothetical protein